MNIFISSDKFLLGKNAAETGSQLIKEALAEYNNIAIIVATGASQFEMIDALTQKTDIDWSRITVFHLDEYIGLPYEHPASFRRYLQERFVDKLPNLKEFIGVNGSAEDIDSEIERLNMLISQHDIAVCFAGIGENCHLAFNDPPADFETSSPYIVVNLDEACRKQQLGEKWFSSLEEVPTQAISMSIKQICKSKNIILSIPDARKADAVKVALEGDVSPYYPASILQNHSNCLVFLDKESSSKLTGSYKEA